ncbi:MAG: FAD binding domain-containing protein [Gammaproteobacteria bacterium]|jgi:4-hydroxybenzoyl-CoA reductase subunit beta|nr:FAD binding domain-containing protein [Gammaproteobacteria bacterium]
MLLPEHTYHRPASLDECLALVGKLGGGPDAERLARVQLIAGGTDVIFNMRLKFFRPENLVSVRRLAELQQVEELADGGLRLGASCRLVDLADDSRIADRFPAFKQSLDAVASAHVRNMGTLGGNICLETRCWYTNNSEEWRNGRAGCFKTDCEHCHVIPSSVKCHAINNADTPPALLALDASLTLQSVRGVREVPIRDFYQPDGIAHMNLAADELLTHVTLPPCADRNVFIKFTPRRGMDFSLGTVAARASGTGTTAAHVALVVGSISSAPIMLDAPARLLEREGLSDAAIDAALATMRDELGEITNLYGRATYKKQIAKVLVKRAVQQLRAQ